MNATATPSTAMNGSAGGFGDGIPCIANGNAAIKFAGFDEVSEHHSRPQRPRSNDIPVLNGFVNTID